MLRNLRNREREVPFCEFCFKDCQEIKEVCPACEGNYYESDVNYTCHLCTRGKKIESSCCGEGVNYADRANETLLQKRKIIYWERCLNIAACSNIEYETTDCTTWDMADYLAQKYYPYFFKYRINPYLELCIMAYIEEKGGDTKRKWLNCECGVRKSMCKKCHFEKCYCEEYLGMGEDE